jgi:hypothetical protein
MNTRQLKLKQFFVPSLLAIIMLSGCVSPKKLGKDLEKMGFKAQPELLEVKGDSIEVSINMKIPPKSFHKKAVVKFQPILKYGEQEKELATMYLQGEKVRDKKGKTVKFAKGGSFKYHDKIEYTTEMKHSKLSMDYQIKIASKYDELNQCISGKRDSTTRGTITTALSVKPYDDIYFFTGNEHPNLYDSTNGGKGGNMSTMDATNGHPELIFYYVIDEGKLRDSAKRGPAARTLSRYIGPKEAKMAKKGKKGKKNDAAEDEKELRDEMAQPKVTGVVFKSYASPDGEVNHNGQLCQQRAASANDFVKKEFKRLGVKEINDANFVKQPDQNEDWAGFKNLVEKSSMKGKSDVLAVINSGQSIEEKEKQLRSMPQWNELTKKILPRLRRTEVYLQGIHSGVRTRTGTRSVADLKTEHSSGADSNLSQREMLILAANMDDLGEREKIYKMYADKYPSDWTGQNNYAAIVLKQGGAMVKDENTAMKSNAKIDQALKLFEGLHTQYPANDTITNNYAVAKRFARKYNDAQSGYMSAKNDGVKEDNNMGILFIKYGFYDKAAASFEANRCDYNVALAYTLKGDYDQALNKIECITDKKAEDFYLRAVIGARKNDKTLMTTALTRAAQMDPSLRDRAKNDLEFSKFWDNAEFQNALR